MVGRETSIAKITPPSFFGTYLRERLFRRLDDHGQKPVTWISGPAGSGKTTLIASYLTSKKLPCLWYKVDAGDADIATFFYYMGQAAKSFAPDAYPPLPLLTPEYLMGIPIFARRYFEDLYCRLKSPFVVVLDNYQEVPLDSTFQEIIHTGLSCIPQGIRVIVLSRNEPPASFIRLRTETIHSIGWKDIRFTEDETRKAIRLRDDRKLDDTTLSLLYRKTQGWVAGLVLLIECSKSKNIDYQLLNQLTPEEIFDFFAIEIFRKTNYETRAFLLKTCFLPTMTVQMAEKLTCLKTAGQILAGLEKSHYFIEKRLRSDPVYSYHPLFREFLVSKSKDIFDSDEIAEIQCDAALLLIDAGQTEEAASLLLVTEDWDRFIPLVLNQAPSLLAQGRRETLGIWLDAIPRERMEDIPWLLYWQGVCRLGFVNSHSRDYFEHSFYLFEIQRDDAGTLLAWSGVINSIFFDFDDFRLFDPWINWLDTKMSQGFSFPSREVKLSVSTSMIIALIHRMPAHPNLKEWVKNTWPLSIGGVNIGGGMPTYPFFIVYYLSVGDFENCGLIVEEMCRMLRSQDASPLLVITLRLVEALMCTTSSQRHEEGIEAVSAGLELAQNAGSHLFDPLLLGVGVQNALNAMDMTIADEFLSSMEQVLKGGCRGHSCYFYYLSAWYHLCSENHSRAVVFGEKCMQIIEEIGLSFPEADCRVMLALAHHANRDFTKARRQIDEIGTLVLQMHSTFLEYRYYLLEALLAFERNMKKAGKAWLAKAMNLGRQKGFVTMANFWQPTLMSYLCAKALETKIEVEHVRNLILKLNLKPDASVMGIHHWPWPVQICTLGRFEIFIYGKKLEFHAKTPHKLLALLKTLIACGPKGASEEQLADSLWPESDGDTALKSLEISIHRLRKLLGNNKVLELREGRVKLAEEYCLVDAHAFEVLLDRAEEIFSSMQQQAHSKSKRMEEAWLLTERSVEIYRGGFLDGSLKPWSLSYSERLRYKFLQAVTRLGDFYERKKCYKEATRWYGKGLEVDDGAEPFYRGLMRCYLAMGRSSEALSVYHRCKKIMKTVFDVPLSCEMEDLYRQLPT